jgi:acyl carrier protein
MEAMTMTNPDVAAPAADPELRERVVESICELLPGILGHEVAGLSAGTGLIDTLGMTSVGALELILRLEERLELEISVEDLDREDFGTVGALAGYVAANLLEED